MKGAKREKEGAQIQAPKFKYASQSSRRTLRALPGNAGDVRTADTNQRQRAVVKAREPAQIHVVSAPLTKKTSEVERKHGYRPVNPAELQTPKREDRHEPLILAGTVSMLTQKHAALFAKTIRTLRSRRSRGIKAYPSSFRGALKA